VFYPERSGKDKTEKTVKKSFLKFGLFSLAVVALGLTVGCDNSKSSGNSTYTPNVAICASLINNAEQYQACVNSITGTGTFVSNGIYRTTLNVSNKSVYEDYLERLNICGNGIDWLNNNCTNWDDYIGVEVQFFTTTAPQQARVFIDSIANGGAFNYQQYDGTTICYYTSTACKPALMNQVGQFVMSQLDTQLAMEANNLRLVLLDTTIESGTTIPISLLYNGTEIASGELSPVSSQATPSCYVANCFY
tara:strand:+ start:68847 stop:69593 length:747 start_codon:yes stop_codon:yes gene_type:complete